MISSILSAALIKFNSLNHLISFFYSHHSFNLSFRELGIGIVAYGPLGHGFFGGKAVAESLPNESLLVCVHNR